MVKICPNCSSGDVVNRYLMGADDAALFSSNHNNFSNIGLLSQDFYFCRHCMYAGPLLEIDEEKVNDYASKVKLSYTNFGSNTSRLKNYVKIENLIAVFCLVIFFILFFISGITKEFIFLLIGGVFIYLAIFSIFLIHIIFTSKKK